MQPKHTWPRNDVGSPKSTSFMKMFQVGFVVSVLPASLISCTYTEKNSPLAQSCYPHYNVVGIHLCDECTESILPVVCRMPESIV